MSSPISHPKPSFSPIATTVAMAPKRKRLPTPRRCLPSKAAAAAAADIEDFSPDQSDQIRAALLRWYYQNQRSLPWRVNQCEEEEGERERERRAYAVWVSEVMLQQTRVATVVEYYKRWMERWPTVHGLANASQEEVNEIWAGLGYYRRARFLLEGAKSIVEAGEFPKTAIALQKVPGIGKYTAGAIASIAFKEPVPVVDGNVIRVLARLRAISANPKESTTIQQFWRLSGQLVDPSRPGDFNQALMELGATLCSTTTPGCSECPISSQCRAYDICSTSESWQVTDFPLKVVKAKQRHEFAAVCVLEITKCEDLNLFKETKNETNFFLLSKRPKNGLLAGLWEFPSVLLAGEEVNSSKRRKAMDQYLECMFKLEMKKKGRIMLRKDVGEYIHIFSHIRLKMYIEWLVLYAKGGKCVLEDKKDQISTEWKFADTKTMRCMGLTSGVRKVYEMVMDFKRKEKMVNCELATKGKITRCQIKNTLGLRVPEA